MRIGLIGCVKSKRTSPAPAGDLYTSALFRGRRAAVEASCDRWFVLSALHGLIPPEEVLEPYDLALTGLPVAARREWSSHVLSALGEELGELAAYDYEVHAGAAYIEYGLIDGLRDAGASVDLPVAGLALGQQLAWYAGRAPRGAPHAPRPRPRAATPASKGPRDPGGRYGPLHRHLVGLAEREVSLSFDEVERLIDRSLPASARQHRAWWSNGSHSQSRAWLDAGYEVADVDQRSERVRFRRVE